MQKPDYESLLGGLDHLNDVELYQHLCKSFDAEISDRALVVLMVKETSLPAEDFNFLSQQLAGGKN